jgi:hypothetical protein
MNGLAQMASGVHTWLVNYNNFCLSLMIALLNSCGNKTVAASHSKQSVVQAIRIREVHLPLPLEAGAQA